MFCRNNWGGLLVAAEVRWRWAYGRDRLEFTLLRAGGRRACPLLLLLVGMDRNWWGGNKLLWRRGSTVLLRWKGGARCL